MNQTKQDRTEQRKLLGSFFCTFVFPSQQETAKVHPVCIPYGDITERSQGLFFSSAWVLGLEKAKFSLEKLGMVGSSF
jgi:hypothetical protein